MHTFECTDCCQFNKTLAREILSLETSELTTRTHFFAGRYENVYIPAGNLTHISRILDTALEQGAALLGYDKDQLSIGFWLNIMRQGDVTLTHTHDDDDELLSGTYYITIPDNTSRLVLNINGEKKSVEPKEGLFVFFDPVTPHEVTENKSSQPRISIGFNIGLKRDQHNAE